MSRWLSSVFLLVGLVAANQSQAVDFRVDILRPYQGGDMHLAAHCPSSLGDRCEVKRIYVGKVIESMKVSKKKIAKLMKSAFSIIPERELSSEKRPFHRNPKSPLHWRMELSGKVTQGAVLTHPTLAEEKRNEPMERAALIVEAGLSGWLLEKSFETRNR